MNIANNEIIKKELIGRWDKLGLKHSDVIRDAQERSPEMKIDASRFSRWTKGAKLGLSETQVLWLATRWGIIISIDIGEPVLTPDNRIKWIISDYNEAECLRRIKQIFKKGELKVKKVTNKS